MSKEYIVISDRLQAALIESRACRFGKREPVYLNKHAKLYNPEEFIMDSDIECMSFYDVHENKYECVRDLWHKHVRPIEKDDEPTVEKVVLDLLPPNFNQIFAEATSGLRVAELSHLSLNQIELVKLGARIGWKMAAQQEIDLTQKYAEIKNFLGDGNPSSLAGYRLGLTDAQAIMHNHGIVNIKGPIANKPKDFKE